MMLVGRVCEAGLCAYTFATPRLKGLRHCCRCIAISQVEDEQIFRRASIALLYCRTGNLLRQEVERK